MENRRNEIQKVAKMKELGIFYKWLANTKRMTRCKETNMHNVNTVFTQKRDNLLTRYSYLSDMIESSFVFSYTPEGREFWYNIVDNLRSEI